MKITKSVRFDQDQNSAFEQTRLEARLRGDGIRHHWISGLALDVCVLATALDAWKEEMEVTQILKGTRPVDKQKGEET